MEGSLIIVDVSNVAYNQNEIPKLRNIILMKKKLAKQIN